MRRRARGAYHDLRTEGDALVGWMRNATDGEPGTGGGGGGAGYGNGFNTEAGKGGSGIVVIRYRLPSGLMFLLR